MVQIGNVSYRPLDVGQILRDVEDIKGARTNRMIRENAMKRQGQMDEARRGALQGKLSSLGDLITMSPDGAVQFMDAVTRMGDDQRVKAKKSIEDTGRMAAYVLGGETPEEQAQRYAIILEQLPDDVRSKMPDQYDPNVVKFHLSKAMETSKVFDAATAEGKADAKHQNALELEGAKAENAMELQGAKGENALTLQGAKAEDATALEGVKAENALTLEDAKAQRQLTEIGAKGDQARKTNAAKGEGSGIKSADSNNIGRAVSTAFGGFYDPVNGTFSGLDKDTATRALAIRARAERIFMDSRGTIGHGEAVEQAMEEAKDGKDGDDGDPLGLFG
jgi:hypothetical protein